LPHKASGDSVFHQKQITWQSSDLKQLDALSLYRMFQLRQSVFVLEQQCLYADIDELDEHAIHLLGTDNSKKLIAYLRILAPGVSYDEPSIGRVVVAESERGRGCGRLLLDQGIKILRQHYGNTSIRISAQSNLVNLYQNIGFKVVGNGYLEDDIPHQQMLLESR